MWQPKRVKYRKVHRGRRQGTAQAGNKLEFGDYGIKALESAWLTARQIEAARRAITHHLKRGGKIWIRVFPDKPITHKPAETRMGGGKGLPEEWVAAVRRGRVLFEVAEIKEDLAKEALKLASDKLPVSTRFLSKAAEGGF